MRRWERGAVSLGLLILLAAASVAAETTVQLTGRISGVQGTCEQVIESKIHCWVAPGSSAILELTAKVSPPGDTVTIEPLGLPPWVEFVPVSGAGTALAPAIIRPPASAGGYAVSFGFMATASDGRQAVLEVELTIAGPPPPNGDEPGIPYEIPGGKETPQGIAFEIPFLSDASSFVLGRVTDCETGEEIEASNLSTEFFFPTGSTPPYVMTDLEKVIVRCPGYLPREITEFRLLTIPFLFLRLTLVTPAVPDICLEPIGKASLVAVSPVGVCVGNVTTVISSPNTVFEWRATGLFTSFEVFVYDNPCGQYPPPGTPTPTPAPVPAPTPTPVTTTAGVWEPLWDRLTQEQRDELAKRNLSGWGWVKAAREVLGEGSEPVPAEAQVEETEGILLPDTALIARVGPFSGQTTQAMPPLSALLEPGQAFIWQVFGTYEDAEGKTGALLSSPQCIRYQPMDEDTGEVTPVVSCPTCYPTGPEWDCDQPIQVAKPLDYFPKKAVMSPDERVAISILGTDVDALYWKCECLEKTQRKIGSYPERVRYDWQLTGGGQLADVFENSAIYELPVGLNPGEQVTATIRVTLNAPRGSDKSIEGKIILTIAAGEEGCDDYSVQAQITQPKLEKCPPPLPEFGRDCIAVLKYGKADGPISASMVLNPMAYVDEVVLLKAMHTDTDELSIKCENTICDLLPEVDYPLEDPLALTWDDQGAGGTFPLGNTGRCVVYVPPQKDDVSIRCVPQDLIVRDPDARKTENQPVARVAIDLTKCDRDWLPEKDNSTTFTARIYEYRYGRCTYPGPARRITFELTEVSAEQGYCVNRGPSWENDLLFSQALLDGSFHLCIGTASSSRPPYFTQATTRTRGTEAIVTVSSEDYGSYGEMASSAFNARALSPREPGGDVVCQVDRNSVDIPRDDIPQDGNHIADKWDLLYPGDDGETADQDASVNNAQRGDGLTRYEEYRGVDVDDSTVITYNPARTTQQELADPQNERLSPYQKDLFVTSYDEADFAQLLYGRAYEEAWIMVHKFTGSDRRGIDVLQVDVTAGTPPNAFFTTPLETDRDGHLNKLHTPTTERDWRADWLGGSYTDSQSGEYAMPLVFDKCIDAYFHEKSYVDGTTLANFGAAPADWEWSGAPNGQLDNQVAVEDRNDNGSLQSWEDDDTSSGGWNFPDNGDGGLDGDYLGTAVRALAFISRAWTGDLSVFDFDNDGRVELGANDYTLARVTLHVLTHEMGHALGIRAHCQDSTCLMYEATLNWDRQDHLCPRCQGLLRIHND